MRRVASRQGPESPRSGRAPATSLMSSGSSLRTADGGSSVLAAGEGSGLVTVGEASDLVADCKGSTPFAEGKEGGSPEAAGVALLQSLQQQQQQR